MVVLVAASLAVVPGHASADGAGGGRSGDFTVDERADVLARVAADGRLVVYPRTDGTGLASFAAPVTINGGWGGMRWIGVGDVDSRSRYADVLSVDHAGVMRVAMHRGTFDGTRTLDPQVVVGTGWQINDLIHTTNVYSGLPGRTNVIARRAGTGDTYFYRNTGRVDLGLFEPPTLLFGGRQNDVMQALGYYTDNSAPDLLFVDTAGRLGVLDEYGEETYWLGTGWNTVDSITLVESYIGEQGIMARRRSDGALLFYRRTTHEWEPAPDGTAYHIYAAPEVVGHNWYVNNIIT